MFFFIFQVLEQKPHGRPTDVYSLACFLLELTVGVPSQDTLEAKVREMRFRGVDVL